MLLLIEMYLKKLLLVKNEEMSLCTRKLQWVMLIAYNSPC